MATNPPQLARRPDIDGLRAVAIVPVVLFHASIPGFNGGFVGVDVFFVISGYLITRIIAKEIASTGSFRFANFYARRARRLLPAAILVIVVSTIATRLIVSPLQQDDLMKSALSALLYVSNIYFWYRTTNYFSTTAESDIFLHTWSLAVEEQFYLVWPLLMLAAFLLRKRIPLWLLMGTILLVSFYACATISYRNQPLTFFLPQFRAWEFAGGALAGLVADKQRRGMLATSLIGIALIAVPVVTFSGESVYPGYIVAFPVVGTAMLLIAGSSDHPVSSLLRTPPARAIGFVSYSWYLWHWPVLILGQQLTGESAAARIFLAALSLALAGLTYKLVEHPIRTNAYLGKRPVLSLASAAMASAAAVGTVSWLWLQARSDMLSPSYRAFTLARSDLVEAPGCMTDFGDNEVRICAFGSGDRTLALIGDSHAQMWLPAIVEAAPDYRVVTFFKSSCPAADVQAFNRRLNRIENECSEWRRAVLKKIGDLNPELVILTSAQGHVKNLRSHDDWRDGYRRTLTSLGPRQAILINSTPSFRDSIPECLARSVSRKSGDCSAPRSEAIDPRTIRAEKEAAQGLVNVRVLDLTGQLCGPVRCEPVRNGQVVYRDTNHITASYARNLAKWIEREIVAAETREQDRLGIR